MSNHIPVCRIDGLVCGTLSETSIMLIASGNIQYLYIPGHSAKSRLSYDPEQIFVYQHQIFSALLINL